MDSTFASPVVVPASSAVSVGAGVSPGSSSGLIIEQAARTATMARTKKNERRRFFALVMFFSWVMERGQRTSLFLLAIPFVLDQVAPGVTIRYDSHPAQLAPQESYSYQTYQRKFIIYVTIRTEATIPYTRIAARRALA
jgi:hypothetical protein